jgi:hypothetical protein
LVTPGEEELDVTSIDLPERPGGGYLVSYSVSAQSAAISDTVDHLACWIRSPEEVGILGLTRQRFPFRAIAGGFVGGVASSATMSVGANGIVIPGDVATPITLVCESSGVSWRTVQVRLTALVLDSFEAGNGYMPEQGF